MSALNFGYGGASYTEPYQNSGRHKTNAFFQGCTALCAGQMIGGFSVAFLSYIFLFGYMLATGVVVGLALIGAGGIGIIGNLYKNRDLINFHIVGAILGIVLCSQFVGQVWREVSVDCALAELFLKTNALDDLTKTLAQHDMFSSVHDRLNELEEALEIVNYGMEQTVSILKQTGESHQERDHIRNKLEVIRFHAEKIIEDIKTRPETSEDEVKKWNKSDRSRLQVKMATAQNILNRIARHDDSELENAFTPVEYERMVQSLLHVIQMPIMPGQDEVLEHTDLRYLADEMDVTKSVIDKTAQGVRALDELQDDTDTLTEESRKRRQKYESEFKNLLQVARSRGKKDVTARALRFMPEHCVKESKAINYLGFLGLAVACLELATIYISLCVSFRLPVKTD